MFIKEEEFKDYLLVKNWNVVCVNFKNFIFIVVVVICDVLLDIVFKYEN